MAVEPVIETDFYGKGFQQVEDNMKMKGGRILNFGATRTDIERLTSNEREREFIDTRPSALPEKRAWQMRPREKRKEIGPSMKFGSHFQAERLMEKLKDTTCAFFTQDGVVGGNV